MSVAIERFVGLFSSLPGELMQRLDRNFARLAIEESPKAITSTMTFKTDDTINSLQVDATAGAVTVYLPLQPNGNRIRRVIKTDVSANAVTVSGNGYLINGASTYALAAQYKSVTVEPTGLGWLVIAST